MLNQIHTPANVHEFSLVISLEAHGGVTSAHAASNHIANQTHFNRH